MKLEVKKIGNSTGLILPKELLQQLKIEQGQWLYVTEMPDGGIRLTPNNPDFEKVMDIVEQAMRDYRNALTELAK